MISPFRDAKFRENKFHAKISEFTVPPKSNIGALTLMSGFNSG